MLDRQAIATPTDAPASPDGASDAARPAGLVAPHRAGAILAFSLIAACCGGLTVLAWALLKLDVLSADHPDGELILILSLLTLAGCGACCIAAWVMAGRDLVLMASGGMDPAGRWRTAVGKLIAMVLLIAGAVAAVVVVAMRLQQSWSWFAGD